MQSRVVHSLLSTIIIMTASGGASAAGIAGLTPDQRPEGAPSISAVSHDDAWLQHALSGVEPPAPESLRWLADQGNWFTPFTGPGMTGPYDIRGWHGTSGQPAGNN